MCFSQGLAQGIELGLEGIEIPFFTTTPTINPNRPLTLRCSIGGRNVARARALLISTNGTMEGGYFVGMDTIASIQRRNLGRVEVFDNSPGFHADGDVWLDGNMKGWLEATWDYPGPNQQGQYCCAVMYMYSRGYGTLVDYVYLNVTSS